MDHSLSYRSARGLAADIREGRISSRELVTAQLDRIAARDGETNLVVTRDPERALRESDQADALRRSGASLPPLHGVGITVKDSFMTEGMRTTSGAPELSDFIPEQDAVPIARLRAAGAVILGKTNLPIYAGDTQSYNEIFGTSANPWNLERTPGGSSGGSAGALAAGFSPLELGSDIGGSIRGPASHCGVVGHKPSYGLVPALGQIPGPPGTLTQADLAVVGPMARCVDDAELGLSILAGPDAWHAKAYRLELPEPRGRETRDYRVAVWLDEPSCPVDPEIRAHILAVAASLEKEGARVDTAARPGFEFEHAVEIFDRLLGAAMCGGFSHATIEKLAERGTSAETAGAIAAKHASQRHRGWLSANERRLQMRAAWETFFGDWDAVLMPAMPGAAPPHDHSKPMAERTIQVAGETRPYFDQLKWVGVVGVAYLPATVVPVGLTREGLPVGVQVVAPFLEDRTALDVARRIEAGLGGFTPPPAFA